MNTARTIYFADGTPAPEVMLEDELVKFLRLKELGIKNPTNTLRYYREKGKLKPTGIGNRNVYTLNDICAFLERLRPRKEQMKTKRCPKCGVEKTFVEFGKNKSRKDGKAHLCKKCKSEWTKASRAKDPEKYRAKDRVRYAKNPEKYRAQQRARRAKNPEKYRAQQRARRAKNREKYRAKDRVRYAKNPEKYRAQQRTRRAKDPEKYRAKCRKFYHKKQGLDFISKAAKVKNILEKKKGAEDGRKKRHRKKK